MRKSRKAQITIFLLLCVVIAFAIGIVQMNERMKNPSLEQTIELSAQDIPVKKWIDSCIELAAGTAAVAFGIQQGYYHFPSKYLEAESGAFNYYGLDERNVMPTNSFFADELATMMNEELLELCTDFSAFEEQGYQFSWQEPKTKATLLEDKVLFDISFPLLINKDVVSHVSEFSYVLPYRIGHTLNISRALVDAAISNPRTIDATLFSLFDLGVIVVENDPCNHIYFLLDNESKSQGEETVYLHSFAVGFSDRFCIEMNQQYPGKEIEFSTLEADLHLDLTIFNDTPIK